MIESEYRKKHRPELLNRSWPYTIVCGVLFLFVAWGIVSSWKYLGHDPYIIGAVIVPASIVALFLLIATINGRKSIINDAWASALELIFWWRP